MLGDASQKRENLTRFCEASLNNHGLRLNATMPSGGTVIVSV